MKYSIIVSLILCCFIGCKKTYTIEDYEKMNIFEYLENCKDNESILISSLILSKVVYPDIKFQHYIDVIDSITRDVKSQVGISESPYIRIAYLNKAIYQNYGLEYDKTDFMGRNFENQILTSVLDRHRGVCTTMPLVYMLVAERLDYPVKAVRAPNHFFCRYITNKQPFKINIEATSGVQVSDICYIEDMQIPRDAYQNKVYLSNMSKREYIGSLLCIIAGYYLSKHDENNAVLYFEKGVELDPKNTEAMQVMVAIYMHDYTVYSTIDSYTADRYAEKIRYYGNSVRLHGIAPPCPPDYWKQSFSKNEKYDPNDMIEIKKDGVTFHESKSLQEREKKLMEKYHSYFQ